MSDEAVGRYRRAYPRIWRHPVFRKLSKFQQNLALYLFTGPQTNRIGLFYFSDSTAAEDLNVGVDTLRGALAKVAVSFGWLHDADARVVYIPSWWRWNRPDHDKVLMGNLKDLSEVPPCALVEAFARNLTYLDPKLHETFARALRIRLPKAPGSQEQYQDPETGKQEAAALRAPEEQHAPRALSLSGKSKKETLRCAVVDVLRDTPKADMDYHVDAVMSRYPDHFSRNDVIVALNEGRVQRRSA